MPSRIIQTHRIGGDIIDLIASARSRVILISPYLATWGHLESSIAAACKRKVRVSLLYRKEKRNEYKALVEKLTGLGAMIGDLDNLHAKLYVSDSACIVTSMNLYDFSTTNSEEFALFSDERQLHSEVLNYAEGLLVRGEQVKPKSLLQRVGGQVIKAVANASSDHGTCIRCAKAIKYNPDRPLCLDCYKAWSKFENPDYAEKHCHGCGAQQRSSVNKPLCKACYARDSRW